MIADWRVQWTNPYTEPPEGQDRVLREMVITDWQGSSNGVPRGLADYARDHPGYGIFWLARVETRAKWSQEAKARNRKRRLRERLQRKYPLLWEQFYKEALAARPAYYDASDPLYDAPLDPTGRDDARRNVEGV